MIHIITNVESYFYICHDTYFQPMLYFISEIACDPLLLTNADDVDQAGPYNYPASVDVMCKTGFFLVDGGDNYTTKCRADGTWTRTDPCVRKYPKYHC